MATWRDTGVNYGGQHIGKGVTRLLKEIDKALGKETAPVQEKPSTWVIVAGTFLLPTAAVLAKLEDPWDKLAILTGGFLSTNLWDIIEEAMAAAGGGGAAAGAPYVPPTYVPPAPTQATPAAPTQAPAPAATRGRYQVTG
jgi:hypothetical protein